MGAGTSPDIVIRDVVEEDIAEIAAIERASLPTPWSEISFFNEFKKPESSIRVAVRDGRIAGYICFSRVLDEANILTVAVRQEARRRGIASLLVADTLDQLASTGCGTVYLEVRVSNGPARELYERFGFREIGIRKRYYSDPVEDGVLMSRILGHGAEQRETITSLSRHR